VVFRADRFQGALLELENEFAMQQSGQKQDRGFFFSMEFPKKQIFFFPNHKKTSTVAH
jgi:hypothetical protein